MEVRVEYVPLVARRAVAKCPCGGDLRFSGSMTAGDPTEYDHRCTACNRTVRLGRKFPDVEFVTREKAQELITPAPLADWDKTDWSFAVDAKPKESECP